MTKKEKAYYGFFYRKGILACMNVISSFITVATKKDGENTPVFSQNEKYEANKLLEKLNVFYYQRQKFINNAQQHKEDEELIDIEIQKISKFIELGLGTLDTDEKTMDILYGTIENVILMHNNTIINNKKDVFI